MKKFLLPIIAAISFTANAQSIDSLNISHVNFQQQTQSTTWKGSAFYDVRNKVGAAVVFNKLGDLTIHGKQIGIEVDGFAGVASGKDTPAIAGFSLLWHKYVTDQIGVIFGVGIDEIGGKRIGGGPIAGVSFSF